MIPARKRLVGFGTISTLFAGAVSCGMVAPGGSVTPLGVGVAVAAAGLPWLFLAVMRRPIERSEVRVAQVVKPEPRRREDVTRG